jgi:hypothetical protein
VRLYRARRIQHIPKVRVPFLFVCLFVKLFVHFVVDLMACHSLLAHERMIITK